MFVLLGVLAQIILFITIITYYKNDIRKVKIELEYANCYLRESQEEVRKLNEKVKSLDSISQIINSKLMKRLAEKKELEEKIACLSNENDKLKQMLKESMD